MTARKVKLKLTVDYKIHAVVRAGTTRPYEPNQTLVLNTKVMHHSVGADIVRPQRQSQTSG